MKKALRVISFAMPFVVFILFFIPFLCVNLPSAQSETGDITAFEAYSPSVFDTASIDDNVLQGCTITFFILALAISIATAILSRKHPVCACFNAISAAYFWIYAAVVIPDFYVWDTTPHAAFYISLILSAFFLAVFIAYAVKWLKARLDSRPPREHKPTKAERIAELEARVRELENRD